jgi:hypothetical protein
VMPRGDQPRMPLPMARLKRWNSLLVVMKRATSPATATPPGPSPSSQPGHSPSGLASYINCYTNVLLKLIVGSAKS